MSWEADRLETAARSLHAEAAKIRETIGWLRWRFDTTVHGSNAPWQGPSAGRMFETIDRRNTRLRQRCETMDWLAWRMEGQAREVRRDDEAKRRAGVLA